MQTHGMAASTAAATNRISVPRASASQKVLIVNGSSDVLEVLEPVLEAGNYDVVFVESSGHAYSQIRRVQPDLVILCVQLDDVEGLHVLSMLKLDAETRNIPVVTYTSPADEEPGEEEDESEPPLFTSRPAFLMN
jgi:two-component system, cell cycle response regulator DivK